ncbi:MAG: glycosyltransferase family A protein [Vicinamibacteraceae bacterium]
MPHPTVSVIVPAFRTAPYIAETLDSALAQTFQDFEIVVVNDGSPDTPDLRAAIAPYRDRIRYIEQPQGGAANARNTAIAASSGEYLAFLDGDDLWAPTFLAEQLALLAREPEVVLLWADSQPFGMGAGAATLMTMEPPPPDCTLAAVLLGRCVVVTSTTVAKRQAVVAVGAFDDGLRLGEDYDLWLKLAAHGRLRYNPAVLGRRRLHPTSLSAVPTSMLRAQIAVRRRFIATAAVSDEVRQLAEAADLRCEAEMALAEGHRLLATGDATGAHRELTKAARTVPGFKLAAIVRLLAIAPSAAVALYRWRRGPQALR